MIRPGLQWIATGSCNECGSMRVRLIRANEKDVIEEIVSIHLAAFQGFFLTFLGRGFLRQMYRLLAVFSEGRPAGFLAYSENMRGLYKFMLRRKLIPFAWYGLWAFLRKPAVFTHLLRAFLKPGQARREEKYVELASIGVTPSKKSQGIGSRLMAELKGRVDFEEYAYIALETDAVNNDAVNCFYQRNGFALEREYTTPEGRRMNEYRYRRTV